MQAGRSGCRHVEECEREVGAVRAVGTGGGSGRTPGRERPWPDLLLESGDIYIVADRRLKCGVLTAWPNRRGLRAGPQAAPSTALEDGADLGAGRARAGPFPPPLMARGCGRALGESGRSAAGSRGPPWGGRPTAHQKISHKRP